jgi:hypothetical protein
MLVTSRALRLKVKRGWAWADPSKTRATLADAAGVFLLHASHKTVAVPNLDGIGSRSAQQICCCRDCSCIAVTRNLFSSSNMCIAQQTSAIDVRRFWLIAHVLSSYGRVEHVPIQIS